MKERFGSNSVTYKEFYSAWHSVNIDTEYNATELMEMARDHLKVTLHGLPLNPRFKDERQVRFTQRVEVIAQMPQFAIVRFQPDRASQETLSVLTPTGLIDDDYLAIWHEELNRDNQVQELLAAYNRDNLMDISI
jgi:hypothetical protein